MLEGLACPLLREWFVRKKCIRLGEQRSDVLERERERQRETVTYGLLIKFLIGGQSTSTIKYCITASHLDLYCHNDY